MDALDLGLLVWAQSNRRSVAQPRGGRQCARRWRKHPSDACFFGGYLDILQILVSRGADIHHTDHQGYSSLLNAALKDQLPVCMYLLSLGADMMVVNAFNRNAITDYGHYARPFLSPATVALRCAALEAAWAAGPHPSQVQRRRDERWFRRGPLITVLAEHAYRPLWLRAQAIAAAAVGAPLPLIAYCAKEVVLRHEGLARYVILYL